MTSEERQELARAIVDLYADGDASTQAAKILPASRRKGTDVHSMVQGIDPAWRNEILLGAIQGVLTLPRKAAFAEQESLAGIERTLNQTVAGQEFRVTVRDLIKFAFSILTRSQLIDLALSGEAKGTGRGVYIDDEQIPTARALLGAAEDHALTGAMYETEAAIEQASRKANQKVVRNG
jgi:hypothetical protein